MQHNDLSTSSEAGCLSALCSLLKVPPSPSLAPLFCRNLTIHKCRSVAETRVNCQIQIQSTEI